MAKANVTPLASAIISGDEDLTLWTDEDLLRGRRGKRGRPPKVVPTAILQELTRRRFLKAEEVVKSSLVSAVELWKQIVEDETLPHALRLRASELIVDRCWGKATERIDANVDIKEPAWLGVVRRAIQVDGTPVGELPEVRRAMGDFGPIPARSEPVEGADEDADIVDAELVEPEDEDDPILWDE